jgi:3-oxoacid CoA-transferase
VELCPQGTLAERIRAGGAGIPGFYTPTGVNTLIQTGGIPIQFGPKDDKGKRTVVQPGNVRETKVFDGRTYNLETAIKGDIAVLRAWKVDKTGNCIFR